MTIRTWLDQRRAVAGVKVSPLPWRENREWHFEEGVLRHETGGFFSVIGVQMDAPKGVFHGSRFPIIHQPEIGLLGFLVQMTSDGPRWLLQAKAEPGTIGKVQIGPTVQATRSNYRCLHGGTPTHYLDMFLDASSGVLSDSQQSEQGNRFLHKFNRNMLREVSGAVRSEGEAWRWFHAAALRQALAEDFTINTDARSVIVCSDWGWLCENRVPFSPQRSGFSCFGLDRNFVDRIRHGLRASYTNQECSISEVTARLEGVRARAQVHAHHVPLESLKNWSIGTDAIIGTGIDSFDVCSFDVLAVDRERPHWQQPLMRPHKEEVVRLFLAWASDELRCFFGFAHEPGFEQQVQLGPSWRSGFTNPAWTQQVEVGSKRLMRIRQSDEGGRFMYSRIVYEIWLVPSEPLKCKEGEWLNLAQVSKLCRLSGVVTNEARSVVSLLLSWS